MTHVSFLMVLENNGIKQICTIASSAFTEFWIKSTSKQSPLLFHRLGVRRRAVHWRWQHGHDLGVPHPGPHTSAAGSRHPCTRGPGGGGSACFPAHQRWRRRKAEAGVAGGARHAASWQQAGEPLGLSQGLSQGFESFRRPAALVNTNIIWHCHNAANPEQPSIQAPNFKKETSNAFVLHCLPHFF